MRHNGLLNGNYLGLSYSQAHFNTFIKIDNIQLTSSFQKWQLFVNGFYLGGSDKEMVAW